MIGDLKVELDETFTVLLSALNANTRNIVFGTKTGTELQKKLDAASNIVSTVANDETNSGTTNFTFTVTLPILRMVPQR